jgi:aspartyl protease family protein
VRGARTAFLLVLVLLATLGATGAELDERGKAAYARGDYVLAEQLFGQAIARAPGNPVHHYHRAVALTRLSRWREASAAYEAVLRLRPSPEIAAAARTGLESLAPMTRRPEPESVDTVEVPIHLQRAGIWTADVVLNDTRTVRFLVDTGATFCMISPALASTLGIDPGPRPEMMRIHALSGMTTGPLVSVPSVRLGDAEARNVAAVIHAIPPGMDGILGNTFLSRFTVTLDAERSMLTLRPR